MFTKNASHSIVTSNINMYIDQTLCRSSYARRSQNIRIEMYKDIDNEVTKIMNKCFDSRIKTSFCSRWNIFIN